MANPNVGFTAKIPAYTRHGENFFSQSVSNLFAVWVLALMLNKPCS